MPSFKLTTFRPLVRNSLRGFASGRLDYGDGSVVEISEIAVHRSGARTWVAWPSGMLADSDEGTLHLGGAVIAATRLARPDVLTAGGGARG
jgi:hypothetical protein